VCAPGVISLCHSATSVARCTPSSSMHAQMALPPGSARTAMTRSPRRSTTSVKRFQARKEVAAYGMRPCACSMYEHCRLLFLFSLLDSEVKTSALLCFFFLFNTCRTSARLFYFVRNSHPCIPTVVYTQKENNPKLYSRCCICGEMEGGHVRSIEVTRLSHDVIAHCYKRMA
jgi:hypothetical protein